MPNLFSIVETIAPFRKMECGGPDSNRRTPTGMDPESIAFNLARQPPQSYPTLMGSILKNSILLVSGKVSLSILNERETLVTLLKCTKRGI